MNALDRDLGLHRVRGDHRDRLLDSLREVASAFFKAHPQITRRSILTLQMGAAVEQTYRDAGLIDDDGLIRCEWYQIKVEPA